MGGCCAEFCQRLRRPGDTDKDDRLRCLLLPVCATFSVIAAASVVTRFLMFGSGMWGAFVIGCAIVLVACSFVNVFILTRMRGSYTTMVSVMALPLLLGILAIDLANVSTMDLRMWPILVLVMDMLIVIESKRWVQLVIVALTLAWLTVMAVEDVAMFGAFELGKIGEPEAGVCNCDDPPCASTVTSSALAWLLSSSVFVVDFHFTRGFATGLRHQLDVNSATVRVSGRLVQLLAGYNTEDARKLIEAEGKALPEELHASYEQLLDNLDSYRVFLPDALLYSQPQQQHGKKDQADMYDMLGAGRPSVTGHPVRAVAPGQGAQAPDVAMCFTDIQSSTELWETHPQAMYTGLIMHNEVMRMSYAACNGYEVKTIGDSFMVAFDGPIDAVRFGLEAQKGLLKQEWPEDLLTHPLCAPALSSDGTPLWGGLRVRIGVQYGSVRPEVSPVTGRCDYFGPTVNTAARLEAVLKKGGLVATSDTVMSTLRDEDLAALGSPVLHDAGPRELKGVREPLHVWALAPRELAERVEVLQCAEGAELPRSSSLRPSRKLSCDSIPQRCSSASGSTWELASSMSLLSKVRKLQMSAATCAAVRLSLCRVDSVSESYQNLAAAATVAADRTQGVVDSVVSATVTVTWNASRPCADHVGACRCFLGTPFRMPCHLGAASGQVLWGNITAGRRSFATVIGGCVDLATALAEEAERCGDTTLVTGEVVDSCYAKDAANWAQLWQAPGCPPMVVMTMRFSDTDDLRFMGNSVQDSTDNAREQTIAGIFRKACAGEPGSPEQRQALEQLEEIGDNAAGGSAAAALAERIRNGGVRSRAMPRLWMGGQDAQQRAYPVRIETTPSLPELLDAS